MHKIVFPLLILLHTISVYSTESENWSITNLSWWHGDSYSLGQQNASVLRFDHANEWHYGDHFFFFEVTNPTSNGTAIYGEWHPRLSIGKITNTDLSFGLMSDILLAGQLNFSGTGSRAYLYGLGTNLEIPGFTFIKLNGYARRDPTQPGHTFQITSAWAAPFSLPNSTFSWLFDGYFDYAGRQGALESNFLAKPRLMLDVGNFVDKPKILYLGAQYAYWRNKLGIKDTNEHVIEFMVTWRIA